MDCNPSVSSSRFSVGRVRRDVTELSGRVRRDRVVRLASHSDADHAGKHSPFHWL